MTDPFKNQDLSFNSPSHKDSTIEQLKMNATPRYTINQQLDLLNQDPLRFAPIDKTREPFVETNRELIAQLKSNIELLYRGTK